MAYCSQTFLAVPAGLLGATTRLLRAQVLPPGASKGAGVALLLEELGVQPESLMALGDGENDVEMLQASSSFPK